MPPRWTPVDDTSAEAKGFLSMDPFEPYRRLSGGVVR